MGCFQAQYSTAPWFSLIPLCLPDQSWLWVAAGPGGRCRGYVCHRSVIVGLVPPCQRVLQCRIVSKQHVNMFQLSWSTCRSQLRLATINIYVSSLRGKGSAVFCPFLQPPLPAGRALALTEGCSQEGCGWPCDATSDSWWNSSCHQSLGYCLE